MWCITSILVFRGYTLPAPRKQFITSVSFQPLNCIPQILESHFFIEVRKENKIEYTVQNKISTTQNTGRQIIKD